MFNKLLQKHEFKGVLGRKMLSIDKGTIALASDLGLIRTENQDRVAAMRFSYSSESYILLVVIDGMGGMRDGEKAAEIAISSFLSSVIGNINEGVEHALTRATLDSNKAVHGFTAGKGGSTLSACMVCTNGQKFLVNVGDSRIYGKSVKEKKILRLTVDDSLAEVVGGSGTELLQFIGMGEGIKPHVCALEESICQLFLTTDGIHYIESSTLSDIIIHSDAVIQVVERLVATARWCGGPDNATICALDLDLLKNELKVDESFIELYEPIGSTKFVLNNPLTFEIENNNESVEKSNSCLSLSKSLDDSDVLNNKTNSTKTSNKEQENLPESHEADSNETAFEHDNDEEAVKPNQGKEGKTKSRRNKKKSKAVDEEDVQLKMTIFDDVTDEQEKGKDDASE